MLTKEQALAEVQFIADNWDAKPDCSGLAEFINSRSDLQEMFDLQKVLQLRLYEVALPCDFAEKLPMYVTALISELGEILDDQQNWKDWRRNCPPVDKAHLRMELSDAWHHLINITLACGFDAEDMYAEFLVKNAENHDRQDRGY